MKVFAFLPILANVLCFSYAFKIPLLNVDLTLNVLKDQASDQWRTAQSNPLVQAVKQALLKQGQAFKFSPLDVNLNKLGDPAPLKEFSFNDCSDTPSDELVTINSISILPDPIKLPGTVTLSFDVTVKEDLNAPIKAELDMYSDLGGNWYRIPCLSGVGSCTYEDLCETVQDIDCPADLGYSCSCPVAAGQYKLDDLSLDIDASLGISGKIKVAMNLYTGDKYIGCAEFVVELAA